MSLKDHFQFVAQSVRRFDTTGALIPSSPFLANAMARPLRQRRAKAWRILEVGPGTGVVTKRLLEQMEDADKLDCYELNKDFCRHLEERLGNERLFRQRKEQVSLFNLDIRLLPASARYDLVVCSLPFNNFPAQVVREIMEILYRGLRPGASLVYFEYLFIRMAKSATSSRKDRERLQQVEKVLTHFQERGTSRDEVVWMNFPPALVRSITKAK